MVVKAIIVKGGENIKHLRSQLGMFVHCVETAIPPSRGTGPGTEQVVCLNGPLTGVSTALATIAALVAQAVSEPWFNSWASTSNAGAMFPGLVLDLDNLGGKGAGKDNATSMGGLAGGVMQGMKELI